MARSSKTLPTEAPFGSQFSFRTRSSARSPLNRTGRGGGAGRRRCARVAPLSEQCVKETLESYPSYIHDAQPCLRSVPAAPGQVGVGAAPLCGEGQPWSQSASRDPPLTLSYGRCSMKGELVVLYCSRFALTVTGLLCIG